ncbi:hypothetical protein FOA52_008045 [Chlamydomonas sp. UWO 241]|nr:hypothetical protein FOA52_008045 [Chlamydomonas sp. UWO 241]
MALACGMPHQWPAQQHARQWTRHALQHGARPAAAWWHGTHSSLLPAAIGAAQGLVQERPPPTHPASDQQLSELANLAECKRDLVAGRTSWGGRGLLLAGGAGSAVTARRLLLSTPLHNALVLSDEALEGMSIFGESCLADFQARHGEFPEQLLDFLTGAERWDVRMMAYLLYAVRTLTGVPGESGQLWRGYLSSLPAPDDATCLLAFAAGEEVEALQLPHLKEEARTQREWIEWVHKKYFCARTGELRGLGLAPEGRCDTFWAAAMVRTRTFSEEVAGEGITLMVPFADLANHSFDNNGTFGMARGDRTRFELRSVCELAASQEVCITYGQEKTNTELMRDYGFVVPGNPNERLVLPGASALEPLNGESLLHALQLAGDWAKRSALARTGGDGSKGGSASAGASSSRSANDNSSGSGSSGSGRQAPGVPVALGSGGGTATPGATASQGGAGGGGSDMAGPSTISSTGGGGTATPGATASQGGAGGGGSDMAGPSTISSTGGGGTAMPSAATSEGGAGDSGGGPDTRLARLTTAIYSLPLTDGYGSGRPSAGSGGLFGFMQAYTPTSSPASRASTLVPPPESV